MISHRRDTVVFGHELSQPFDRCGLVSTDHFLAAPFDRTFRMLEQAQAGFLAAEPAFRSPHYPWDRDALHQWSRCFEYPYAFAHLHESRATLGPVPTVVDLGSGVTFFPFVLAREGWDVVCLDSDPLVVGDVTRAAAVVPAAPGSVRAQLSAQRLPLRDASADALYSISVLEHVPDPLPLIAETARVLCDGGTFVLTVDVDLTGRDAIGPEQFDALLRECDRSFERRVPETTIHPLRVLDTFCGPHPRARQPQVPGLMLRSGSGALKPLVGGPIAPEPVHLACYVAAFTRRSRT
jgi:SAM-dependent methyltransferase